MYSFLLLTKQTNKKKNDIFKIYHLKPTIKFNINSSFDY